MVPVVAVVQTSAFVLVLIIITSKHLWLFQFICLGRGLLLHLTPLGSQSGQVCLGQPRFDHQPTIRTHYCGVVVDGRYDVRSP